MENSSYFDLSSTLVLNQDNVTIPRLGLGTARMTDPQVAANAVKIALQAGYRLVDTAKNYDNEVPVGRGIRDSGIPESYIFLTTKLEKDDYGYEEAKRGFEGSYQRLGLKKIDLYLIHSPENNRQARVEAWRGLSDLVDGERLRAIGVSNYQIDHIQEIQAAGLPIPTVNQIKLHPFNYREQRELVKWCQRHAIRLMAYSPLGVGDYLDEPVIREIAGRYKKSPAQLLIRWSIQHDFIVIPKSDQADHIHANADVFDFVIASEDMQRLDNL